MAEAFNALNNYPTIEVKINDPTLWDQMKRNDGEGAIMGTITNGQGSSAVGLVDNNFYTALGVAEYNGNKLVIMRNPLSRERYTGPWNDNDAMWTDDAK